MSEKLNQFLSNDIIFSLGMMLTAVIAGVFLFIAVIFMISQWQKRTVSKKFKIKYEQIKKPLFSLLIAICVMFILPILRFSKDIQYVVSHITGPWLIISVGWFIINTVNIFRETLLNNYDVTVKDNLRARRIYTKTKVIEGIIDVVIVLLTVAFVLMTFEKVRQLGSSLLASAGVLGIILGFAAQKTLGNFIAGLQIAIAQPIRIDDVVIVEGEWGWIEEITLTYVVVRIWDLRRLIVPISYFVDKPFQNWTRISADILGSVYIYADYKTPIKEFRDELTRILEKSPHWDKKVNVLQVTNATAETIEIRALMSAESSPIAWSLRCEVREKLLEFLQERFPDCLPKTRVELKEPGKME